MDLIIKIFTAYMLISGGWMCGLLWTAAQFKKERISFTEYLTALVCGWFICIMLLLKIPLPKEETKE